MQTSDHETETGDPAVNANQTQTPDLNGEAAAGAPQTRDPGPNPVSPGHPKTTGPDPASKVRRRRQAFFAAGPVALVNGVAFFGQLAFLQAHLPWPLGGQVTMAVALESIAIYLAYHAHEAQLANDSALRLRLASYGFGLVIGGMNYSHYMAPHGRPTFPALAVGLMSSSSPWLWAIHSRRASRDRLLAAGLIEPHALRLGPTRWTWHPLRSGRVMWMATWRGVQSPLEAIAQWDKDRTARRSQVPAQRSETKSAARVVTPDLTATVRATDPAKALPPPTGNPETAGSADQTSTGGQAPAADRTRQTRSGSGRDERTEDQLLKEARQAYAELVAENGKARQAEVALKIRKARQWVTEHWGEIQGTLVGSSGQAVSQ